MELSFFSKLFNYLVIVNLAGFLLFALNIFIKKKTGKFNISFLVAVFSLGGGSLGVFLSMLFFDRKANKENMMFKVFSICTLIIQILLFLILNENNYDYYNLNYNFIDFFATKKYFLYYLIVINFITVVVYAIDKINATEQKKRVPIVTLLGLAFIGGSPFAWVSMYLFRHKTKKNYFTLGVPLIILTQIVIAFYLMQK